MLRFLLRLSGPLGLFGGFWFLRGAEIRHILVRGHPQAAAHTGDTIGVALENVFTLHVILLSVPGRSVWCGRSC